MKIFFSLILLLLIALAATFGGVYYGQHHPLTPLLSTSTPISDTSPTPNLATYTEPISGFKINYPQELIPSSATPNFPVTAINPHGQVFSFPESYVTTSTLAEATITTTAEEGGQTACARPVPNTSGQPSTQIAIVAGRQWILSTGGDQGAGQIYGYRSYSFAQGATCFRIFLSTHSTNVEPKGQLPPFDETHFEQVLNQIVSTFEP